MTWCDVCGLKEATRTYRKRVGYTKVICDDCYRLIKSAKLPRSVV